MYECASLLGLKLVGLMSDYSFFHFLGIFHSKMPFCDLCVVKNARMHTNVHSLVHNRIDNEATQTHAHCGSRRPSRVFLVCKWNGWRMTNCLVTDGLGRGEVIIKLRKATHLSGRSQHSPFLNAMNFLCSCLKFLLPSRWICEVDNQCSIHEREGYCHCFQTDWAHSFSPSELERLEPWNNSSPQL
jgi:hypothetical protein